jgi:hypothetical protein
MKNLIQRNENDEVFKETEIKLEKLESSEYEDTIDLDLVKSVCILGEVDSGKTNLGFWYLENYKGKRKIYLLGYPKKVKDYINLNSFSDIFKLKDSIIFCDELQKFIKIYDRKSNYQLMELISLFAHKNNTIIFTTQVSQFVTKGVEAFIDVWAIKSQDLESLKNGSKPKRVIQRLSDYRRTDWFLSLEKNEYYEYSERNKLGQNIVKTFPDMGIKKDWR